MKNYFILLFILSFLVCCKKTIKTDKEIPITKIVASDSTHTKNQKKKKELQTKNDFKSLLNSIKEIKHTNNKHQDWMSNRSGFIDKLIDLNRENLIVKTTSYEYKKDLKFYLHTLTHTNDTISIKPFLENAQGKPTEGYTRERVLIFAMKNDNQANFIDIPEKLNPLKLREELLDTLYKRIDSDVIECYRTKKCVYKDLRKEKPE